MTFERKTGGSKRGTPNRRTAHRRQGIAETMKDVTCAPVPTVEFSMLQRLRFTSDYCFALAERERKKGDLANLAFVVALMQIGATSAAKAAVYLHAKPAAMQLDVSKPQPHSIDLQKLSDQELVWYERILMKSLVPVGDQVDESVPRTADEYLP